MIALLSLMLGCAETVEDSEPTRPDLSGETTPAEEVSVPEMASNDLLTRASLDLRGVRPSDGELSQASSPEAVDEMISEFLLDPRFEERVIDMYSEIYLTKKDYYTISGESYGVEDSDFSRAVGEEPLRILGRVAAEGMPWTEIVRADWTMVNETLAEAWPVSYPPNGEGWQQVEYTDGRPSAGVITTNGLWWRYLTTDSNANRGRANQISRILTCEDYLTRPIDFDRGVDLLDGDAVAEALKSNPACVNCHTSLDPIASYLFGFYGNAYDANDAPYYHPERERLYRTYTEAEPAWYGDPGFNMTDLGQQIAADPRFITCAVEQVYELLLRRDATLEDMDALTAHRESFLAAELDIRELFRSVMSDPRYRSGLTEVEGYVPSKMVTPDLLARQIEDLTGFRWELYGYDMLNNDQYGIRTLAGGADGDTVSRNATSPNATLFLVQERLAEAAAGHAVTRETSMSVDRRRLFLEADPTDGSEASVRALLQGMHLRLFGNTVDLDGEEVNAGYALWSALRDVEGSPDGAWRGTLSALLRDPDLLFY